MKFSAGFHETILLLPGFPEKGASRARWLNAVLVTAGFATLKAFHV